MRITVAIALLCAATAASAQQEPGEVKVHPVRGPIHMVEGQGGNVGVSAGPDGALMIDTQFEPMAPAITKAIEDLGHGGPKWVINTHFHGDHTGGNPVFGQRAPIIAHENARTRLKAGSFKDEALAAALPTVTFDDDVTLSFNGEDLHIVHYPTGHTDTDSIIFFTGSNVVHMGDHYFNGAFPFIDTASGGNVAQYIKNVHAVLEKVNDDVKIIPGHGPLSTKAEMAAWIKRIEETVAIIQKGVDEGKSAKDIIDADALKDYADWGKGFVTTNRWIGIVHGDLSK